MVSFISGGFYGPRGVFFLQILRGEGGRFPRSILGQTWVVVYMATLNHILQARVVTHVLVQAIFTHILQAPVVTHVLARVVTHVLARVIMHVHDYY